MGIHISDKLSGTWNTSRKAGHLISERNNKEINVFSSKKLASGLGLMVLRAAKEIESGKSYADITAKMDEWVSKTRLLASTKTLKYMVRGGRVSAFKGFFGKLLGVQPIIVVNKEGKTELFGKPKSQRQSMKIMMEEVTRIVEGEKVWGYAISHAKNLEGANKIADQMEELTGLKPEFINGASPVLGTHTGAGVIALSFMFE